MNTLEELDALARSFSRSATALEYGVALRVLFVADAELGWRLIEIEQFPRRTRMLCFESADELRSAIEGRLAWERADEEFRANHMATPGGFPGVTFDWVHSKDFDLMFGASRNALRRELCATPAARTALLR